MQEPVFLPARIARLVQNAGAVNLGEELRVLFEEGRRRVTIGLGPGVDLPLLDEELYAADIDTLDRELVVAAVRAEPDGYVVERGWSSFGVYVCRDQDPMWTSVPYMGVFRGLRPGDQVALGSAPAEALRFHLPTSALVPPPRARRNQRQERAAEQRVHRSVTPTPVPAEGSLPPSSDSRRPNTGPLRRDSSLPRSLTPEQRVRFQHPFEVALWHWNYAMVSFGTDPESVVHIDDADLGGLRAAISRNLQNPERGYDIFVKDPGPELWVKPSGESMRTLVTGSVCHLNGAGNRIGFHGYVVELPSPAVPVPRFGPRHVPTNVEIADVLGLPVDRLGETTLVKARYRALVRRFHPDRHSGDPGHVSRFEELTACLDAWRNKLQRE